MKRRVSATESLIWSRGRPVLTCRAWRRFGLVQGLTVAPGEYHLPEGLRTISCGQVHGAEVVAICDQSELAARSLNGADGLLTDRSHLVLTVRVADCVPVGLYAHRHSVVGLLHAGWRGIAAGILEEAFRCLNGLWDISPWDLYLYLGPAVEEACYPVGREVWEAVRGSSPPEDPVHLDLRAALRDRAEAIGIPPNQIASSSLCTVCQTGLLPSYRREGQAAARAVAFLGLPE